jgi:cytochrome oxidase Cu insertion factor (SCO1/SenC/PrrC family)
MRKLALVSLAVLVAGCQGGGGGKPAVGKSAPEIAGRDADGQSFKLSDYRGKVVVVTFWASW